MLLDIEVFDSHNSSHTERVGAKSIQGARRIAIARSKRNPYKVYLLGRMGTFEAYHRGVITEFSSCGLIL
jgi:hypothetical protein